MSAITAALVARLSGDATLRAFLPDGVHHGIPPSGATRYAIVSLAVHSDTYQFGPATAYETYTYLVKAVTLGPSGLTADQAAARMQQLLHNQPLTATGYVDLRMQRLRVISDPEVDDNQDIRWQHRGGYYVVQVQPLG